MKTMLSRVLVVVGMWMALAGGVAMGEPERKDAADEGRLDPVAKVVVSKLERTVIPKMEMEGASLEEAIDYTRVRMAEYDPDRKIDEPKGISFVIRPPRKLTEAEAKAAEEEAQGGLGAPVDEAVPRVTYNGANVRVLDLLGEMGRQVKQDVYVTSTAIALVPEGEVPKSEVWKVVRVKSGDDAKDLLEKKVVPVVDFDETSVEEALDFLRVRAVELVKPADGEKKGICFVERKPRAEEVAKVPGIPMSEEEWAGLPRVGNYSVRDVTFGEVVREVARQARLDVYLTTGGLILRPAGTRAFASEKEEAASLVERIYVWGK